MFNHHASRSRVKVFAKLTPNEHGANTEDFFASCVGTNVSKTHASQTRTCEVQRCYISVRVWYVVDCQIEFTRQVVDPAWKDMANNSKLIMPLILISIVDIRDQNR